jgi:hypothetical protein
LKENISPAKPKIETPSTRHTEEIEVVWLHHVQQEELDLAGNTKLLAIVLNYGGNDICPHVVQVGQQATESRRPLLVTARGIDENLA